MLKKAIVKLKSENDSRMSHIAGIYFSGKAFHFVKIVQILVYSMKPESDFMSADLPKASNPSMRPVTSLWVHESDLEKRARMRTISSV